MEHSFNSSCPEVGGNINQSAKSVTWLPAQDVPFLNIKQVSQNLNMLCYSFLFLFNARKKEWYKECLNIKNKMKRYLKSVRIGIRVEK